jgi:hypothetical protein
MKKAPYKSREELEQYTHWGRNNTAPVTKEERRAARLAKKKRNKQVAN